MFVVCLWKWRIYNSGNWVFFFFSLLYSENKEMPFSWLLIRRYDAKLTAFNWERENWHWYGFPSSLSAHKLLPGSDLPSLLTWCSGQLSAPSWWQWGFPHRCDTTCHWRGIEGRPGIKEPSEAQAFTHLLICHHCALFLHPAHNLLMVWKALKFPAAGHRKAFSPSLSSTDDF